jgi:hypothetical protein
MNWKGWGRKHLSSNFREGPQNVICRWNKGSVPTPWQPGSLPVDSNTVGIIFRGHHGQESADSSTCAHLCPSPNAHVQQSIPSASTIPSTCASTNLHPNHQELSSWHHEGNQSKYSSLVCVWTNHHSIETLPRVMIFSNILSLFMNVLNIFMVKCCYSTATPHVMEFMIVGQG